MSQPDDIKYIATVGMFDGVHRGHRFLFDELKREAAERHLRPLAVTFTQHPLSLIAPEKMPQVLTPADDKIKLIRRAGIDNVVSLDFDESLRGLSAREFMFMLKERYGVEAILMGYDHRFGHDRLTSPDDYRQIGREIGMEVIFAPPMPGEAVNSSLVRRLLSAGNVEHAARLLGRPYGFSSTVVEGKKLGRKLGFPTANLQIGESGRLLPANGVYAVIVTLPDGSRRGGMLNIGTRPTVDRSDHPEKSVEVNVFDFSGSLYGQPLSVEFIERVRDEREFSSPAELRARLEVDRDVILSLLKAKTD